MCCQIKTEIIFIRKEPIKLGQLLKILKLVSSGGEVNFFLKENKIFINSNLNVKRGSKIYFNFEIRINNIFYKIKKNEDFKNE